MDVGEVLQESAWSENAYLLQAGLVKGSSNVPRYVLYCLDTMFFSKVCDSQISITYNNRVVKITDSHVSIKPIRMQLLHVSRPKPAIKHWQLKINILMWQNDCVTVYY